MNDEYTPTTEAMRERLVEFSYEFSGVPRAETSAEFDRWLAGVIADAASAARNRLVVELDRVADYEDDTRDEMGRVTWDGYFTIGRDEAYRVVADLAGQEGDNHE